MTNRPNSKVRFNLGRRLQAGGGAGDVGVNPITALAAPLPPSLHVPINVFQVRTERCDWPRLPLWAVPTPAPRWARVTDELELLHAQERRDFFLRRRGNVDERIWSLLRLLRGSELTLGL